MSKPINFRPIVTVEATMTLDEGELAALDALVGYGTDSFLKVFYEKMGESYLKPHEKSLRSLFEKVRQTAPAPLAHVRQMRNDLVAAIKNREATRK